MPVRVLSTPTPPIPVGVPSQLLERRPDIAAAERAMAQANALIGVEKAAYYPTVTLTGSTGFKSPALPTLLSLPALFWSLGASATEIIFEGGFRSATVAQYTASYKADVAVYQQTVLTAIQQVEDYVVTLRVISDQIASRRPRSSRAPLPLYRNPPLRDRARSLPQGDECPDHVLGGQQTLIVMRVNGMTAAAQLVEALGGGWDRAQLPAVD